MTAAIITIINIALGIVFLGLIVSSDIVVTASKPRKQKHIRAAPEKIVEIDISGLKNGCKERIEPPPVPPSKSFRIKAHKVTIKMIWNITEKPLILATDLIPIIFTIASITFKRIIQAAIGIAGNWAFRKIPKVRHAIIGENK